jgi:filamentous hemagglutinin family protein
VPFRLSRRLILALSSATLASMSAGSAMAGPNGGTVVGGSATIQGAGTGSVIVNQATPRAVINWNTFNIGVGETTRFNQPNSSSIALNRVVGGLGPTQLLGTLLANGQVYVINGDGVLIGPNAVINTAGFLATTNDIRNEDFMAGKYNFGIPGLPNASVVNLGSITATSGGFAALVAPGVRNSGTITATLGTVSLAAGNAFTLDFYGDKLITLAVNDQIASKVVDVATGKTLTALVSNQGKLSANGGRVELTAAAARAVVDSVINNTGVVEANSMGTRNGMIVLAAATAARKPAGAPTQTVKLSGKISAAGKDKGTTGGTVVVTGESIAVAGAQIDASGQAGGGKVLIGGDTGGGNPSAAAAAIELAKLESFVIPTATSVSVDAASVINASSTGQGNGGKVVLWSDQQTTFAGTILARGGSIGGDGGFVETSSHQILTYNGTVDLSAPKGQVGTVLLDPGSVAIDANPGVGIITASSINSGLLSGDFIVTTGTGSGDITVNSNANLTWANAHTLTLSAFGNINFQSGALISNAGAGNLILRADNTGSGTGTVIFGSSNQIDFSHSTGTVAIFYNPTDNPANSVVNATSYTGPTSYTANVLTNGTVSNQLTAYMLVNTVYDLQNVQNNLTAAYALGRNIDASATATWNAFAGFVPIGNGSTPFVGNFNGNGNTISNLTINLPTDSGAGDNSGLFGIVGNAGVIQNVGLIGGSVTGEYNVGALVGWNSGGLIQNSYTTGTVSGFNGVGGVVGFNDAGAIVTQSHASGPVSSIDDDVGGLVGFNRGLVTLSYATGAVNGPFDTGGLVGDNRGVVTMSFATGNVSGGTTQSGFGLGGLIGYNFGGDGGTSVSQSYATGAVTGLLNVGGLIGSNVSGATVTQSYAAGAVNGSSVVGGLIGLNDGGIVTVSYWNTTAGPLNAVGLGGANGGTFSAGGLTTAQMQDPTAFATNFAGFNFPTTWAPPAGSFPQLAAFAPAAGQSPPPAIITPPITLPDTTTTPLVFESASYTQYQNTFGQPLVLTSLTKSGEVVSTKGLTQPPAPPRPTPGPVGDARVFSVPPLGETRFIKDEVVLQVDCDTPQSALDTVAREMRLTIAASECLTQSHKTIIRMHINNGQTTVANVIRALERYRIIAVAQANYVYQLAQDLAQDPALAGRTQGEGDAAQYAIGKLGLIDIHRQNKGDNISIAIIDSQIDVHHPDMDGVFADQYDAVGGPAEKPHPHGTGMAGAIAAHRKLMGIAPAARIYAIHAFSSNAASADSTTFNILKALDYAASKGVRVINMSFAGPRDVSMERALKSAHDKGIVLIAAAGNAGPKSPPLYPGADPNVIAVTATDSNDKLFPGANRGRYIAVAAPGVDILVPAPDDTYQVTTGTSVASAEVSGVVALMLERNPDLTPEDIRKILTSSARRLGTKDRDDDFGSGLVDPSKAIQTAGDLSSTVITGTTPPPGVAPKRSR